MGCLIIRASQRRTMKTVAERGFTDAFDASRGCSSYPEECLYREGESFVTEELNASTANIYPSSSPVPGEALPHLDLQASHSQKDIPLWLTLTKGLSGTHRRRLGLFPIQGVLEAISGLI